jgi:predicted phosphodiesterase
MKVAVFSDVQANLPALETVLDHIQRWDPELVMMAGDLVNRGPKSLECLELLENSHFGGKWLPVRGNHEDYVMYCANNPPATPGERDVRQFTDWTARQLGDRVMTFESWPDHLDFHPPGSESWVHITHGTLEGNRDGISDSIPDEGLESKLPPETSLFVTAHTHKVHRRNFNGTEIVNVGSVGTPFDGDPRSSYAQLTYHKDRWNVDIIRLPYDRDQMERDCHETGFLDEGGPLARIVFEEWKRAELIIAHWNRRYRQAVLDGEIGIQEAVDEFMKGL